MKNSKKNNKGFSLVELIIVIAIMALLVAIITPSLIQYINKAKKAVDITTAESIGEVFMAEVETNETLYKFYNWHVRCIKKSDYSPTTYRCLCTMRVGTTTGEFEPMLNKTGYTSDGQAGTCPVTYDEVKPILQDICYGLRPLQFQQNSACDIWFVCTDQTGKIYVFVGAGAANWSLSKDPSRPDAYKNSGSHAYGRSYMIWPEVCDYYIQCKHPGDLRAD
ncbi:MAG: type II secretion system protein [Lachnospiraceae bacterium]|nr:type II secretion system protein [Lachnospiraceae bacterium]